MIDIVNLASIVGALLTLAVPFSFVAKQYKKINADISNVSGEIGRLTSWTCKQQKDINTDAEARIIYIKALLNIAKSMKAQGFNHTIDDAIQDLEDYMLKATMQNVSQLNV